MDNVFQFSQNPLLPDVRGLTAAMADFTYERHSHEEYSLGVTLAGHQDFFHNGGYYSSKPGTIILFNPDEIHDGHSGTDETLHYRMIYLHPRQLQPLLDSITERPLPHYRFGQTLFRDEALRTAILQQVINMETRDDSTVAPLTLEAGLYRIVERLCQLGGDYQPCSTVSRPDRLLERVKDYIEAHLHSRLTLADMSQVANMSKYHFLRLFRSQCGITPYQYVLNRRINGARKALEQGNSVEDVAYQYGFSDLSHFNRRFKPVYGTTPRRYQRNLRIC
ncbi:AraC family ligand binding domain-containing protein [Gynuella sp.]|uniref:AraC family transcriptional regulator n=1 Tax=Gynuella sp. TaxID=2969146 RepID=UPI003D0DCDE8